jgi:hypothetical protein
MVSSSLDYIWYHSHRGSETKNDLSADGYSHVSVLREVAMADLDMMRQVKELKCGSVSGDCKGFNVTSASSGI